MDVDLLIRKVQGEVLCDRNLLQGIDRQLIQMERPVRSCVVAVFWSRTLPRIKSNVEWEIDMVKNYFKCGEV
jgi:hypothetical protein